jgi:hypothetical protein
MSEYFLVLKCSLHFVFGVVMRYLFLLLLVVSHPAMADAYKCKGADGKVLISFAPCGAGYAAVRAAESDRFDAGSYNRAQADLQRQRVWLAGRDKERQVDAVAAQQQAAAVQGAYPQDTQQPVKSDSIWDRPLGCWFGGSCPTSKTTSTVSGSTATAVGRR